jgi:delta 1-pyrroline-5-carboxylate dehydrogenase
MDFSERLLEAQHTKRSIAVLGVDPQLDSRSGRGIPDGYDLTRFCCEVVEACASVVAAIKPWNYPLMLGMWKIAPALLAGNTVVLKPSPYTPITTLMLGEILREIVPPGVLNVVSGGDELGAWMTSHPAPRKISFTGSVETGKKVAAATRFAAEVRARERKAIPSTRTTGPGPPKSPPT